MFVASPGNIDTTDNGAATESIVSSVFNPVQTAQAKTKVKKSVKKSSSKKSSKKVKKTKKTVKKTKKKTTTSDAVASKAYASIMNQFISSLNKRSAKVKFNKSNVNKVRHNKKYFKKLKEIDNYGTASTGYWTVCDDVHREAGMNYVSYVETDYDYSSVEINYMYSKKEMRDLDNLSNHFKKYSNLSDLDKLAYCYCYLAYKEDYDDSEKAYDAHSLLIKHKGVCNAYTEATYYILNWMGFKDVRWVESKTHAWNLVKLDGKWYNLDCTWRKFLLSDKDTLALGVHERVHYFSDKNKVPAANETYHIGNMKLCQNTDMASVFDMYSWLMDNERHF